MGAVNLIAEQKPSTGLPDINCLTPIENPLKISKGFLLKYSAQFCARVFCYQQPNPNEPEELTKVKIRAFNYSVDIHQNYFIEFVLEGIGQMS